MPAPYHQNLHPLMLNVPIVIYYNILGPLSIMETVGVDIGERGLYFISVSSSCKPLDSTKLSHGWPG